MEIVIGCLIALVAVQFLALAMLAGWLAQLGERQRGLGSRFAALKRWSHEQGEAHNKLNDHVNKVAVAHDAMVTCHNNLAAGHQQLATAYQGFVEGIRTGKVQIVVRNPDMEEGDGWRRGGNLN